MEITLFSTDCPKCKILKAKLDNKNIEYKINTNINDMTALGMTMAPGLRIDDGEVMEFFDAVQWVNAQEEK